MRLTFMGIGTGFPKKNEKPSSILVETDRNKILIDIGSGITQEVFSNLNEPFAIDILIITHFHLDHLSDLPFFLFALRQSKNFSERELLILGPTGLKMIFNEFERIFQSQFRGIRYSLREVKPKETIKLNNTEINFFKTFHTEDSLGLYVASGDKIVIYTSDTEYNENYERELPQNPDVLITECSFIEEVRGHMNPLQVAKLAIALNPKILALIHLYPKTNKLQVLRELKDLYSGVVIIPSQGLTIQL